MEIYIPPGPRLGNVVIESRHVAKSFGDILLCDDMSFMLPPAASLESSDPTAQGRPRSSG